VDALDPKVTHLMAGAICSKKARTTMYGFMRGRMFFVISWPLRYPCTDGPSPSELQYALFEELILTWKATVFTSRQMATEQPIQKRVLRRMFVLEGLSNLNTRGDGLGPIQ